MDIVVVQLLSHVQLFATPWTKHARISCPSPFLRAGSNSCLLSHWCYPIISSSVIPFSSHLQSFPASGSFPMNQLFASSGQSIGASASASVLPMNIKSWFPLELTGLISLLSKGLSRVFSSTTVQKHQFFGARPFLWPHFSIHTWLLEEIALTRWAFSGKVMSLLINMLSGFDIAFLLRSKCLLISWLESPPAVILEPKKIKSFSVSIVFPSICHKVMGPDAMIFIFSMLNFRPTFSLSSFIFIKRLFSSSLLSVIKVVSSAYLRL